MPTQNNAKDKNAIITTITTIATAAMNTMTTIITSAMNVVITKRERNYLNWNYCDAYSE